MGQMRIDLLNVHGLETAILAMRNPMNSWDKSDSFQGSDISDDDVLNDDFLDYEFVIGGDDMKLCQALLKGGPEESKHLRLIHVQANVSMPRYWWSEMDTYKFVEKVSCSTMHKLLNTDEPITSEQFLMPDDGLFYIGVINDVIENLDTLRLHYRAIQKTKPDDMTKQLNSLLVLAKRILPECYLQMRTIDTNYQELRNIYRQRRNHRLKEEWGYFCDWIESLPYAEELITYGLK